MCGIAGIVSSSEQEVELGRLQSAAMAIRHRGPDNLGVHRAPHVGLAHTRLSIVDLSEGANQPFHSPSRSHTVVFNGEIYNYRELRAELERKGVSFRTNSDTEVVVHAFVEWGTDCFKRFNGIFAIGIWDSLNRRLVLARDRLGVKPLYIFKSDTELLFASEPKSIMAAHSEMSRSIDLSSLHEFLYFGTVLGGKTLFREIRQLQPGSYLEMDVVRQQLVEEKYWSLPTVSSWRGSDTEAVAEVANRIERAVALQLTGEVPIGVFLSGGLDSSGITAFAAKNYAGIIKTYSVAFDFSPSSELPMARRVAQQYGTEHSELRIGADRLEELVVKLVKCHDSPFADAANIPLYLLCEQVSGDVKVILQGDGGDELFGGYRRYATLFRERKFRAAASALRIPGVTRILPWNVIRYLGCFMPAQRAERMARLLTVDSPLFAPTQVLSKDLRNLVERFDPFSRYRKIESSLTDLDTVGAMLATDMQIVLPDVFLEKVDKSTMAHGVEVRVPLLENELVEFMMRVPSQQKVKGGKQKWLMREALRDVLPKEIIDAQKKGFGVPFENWMRGPLKRMLSSRIDFLESQAPECFDIRRIRELVQIHNTGSNQYAFLLWKILNLSIWWELYRPCIGTCSTSETFVPA